MSTGLTPQVTKINLTPLDADPASPHEGDVYYSDGTARTEGPWVYQNGSWAAFSTGAAITVVNSLTLTPQSADPGTPAIGMLFSSDGTSRAAGLWYYNSSSQWTQLTGVRYQEFTNKARFSVRAAGTANVILASQVENGDSFGGVTLATGDFVLLKNQTTTTENGVYVVAASGTPTRHTSYDSAVELTRAQIYVTAGTNVNTRWFQNNTLSSLADPQSWSSVASTQPFVVPPDIYELDMELIAGGGGGGPGGPGVDGSNASGPGGGGGAASLPVYVRKFKVTPGTSLDVSPGLGGLSNNNGSSSIVNASTLITLVGAAHGVAGAWSTGTTAGGLGATTYADTNYVYDTNVAAGANGGSAGVSAPSAGSAATSKNVFLATEAAGGAAGGANFTTGGGGGAGATGKFGAGSNGGNGAAASSSGVAGANVAAANYGSGAGGGGGGSESGSQAGGAGGIGGDGYIKLSWS